MKNMIGSEPADLIVMHGVCQRYFKGGQEISVLSNVDFVLRRGSSILIGLFFGCYPATVASRLSPLMAPRDD